MLWSRDLKFDRRWLLYQEYAFCQLCENLPKLGQVVQTTIFHRFIFSVETCYGLAKISKDSVLQPLRAPCTAHTVRVSCQRRISTSEKLEGAWLHLHWPCPSLGLSRACCLGQDLAWECALNDSLSWPWESVEAAAAWYEGRGNKTHFK